MKYFYLISIAIVLFACSSEPNLQGVDTYVSETSPGNFQITEEKYNGTGDVRTIVKYIGGKIVVMNPNDAALMAQNAYTQDSINRFANTTIYNNYSQPNNYHSGYSNNNYHSHNNYD